MKCTNFLILLSIVQINGGRFEEYATVPQLIRKSGYPLEKHITRTDDGYILQLFRIPGGRLSDTPGGGEKKKAVVLVHGLSGSCDNYLLMGFNKSLAYMLADSGYDVWLANLRGTFFSSHETLSRNDLAFWEYSFHEHGKYDAPAIVDKILNVTGLPKIQYVGHSMGCTTFFIMMALRPEYNDKIISFVGLGPAAYEDNIKSLIHFMVHTIDLPGTLKKRGMNSLVAPPKVLSLMADTYCNVKPIRSNVCLQVLFSLTGEDYDQHPVELTKAILMRINPVSLRQILHYGKIAMTGVFTSWENGFNGTIKPYNLTNIKTPVSLWYGENDMLTEKSQILRLARELNQLGVLHSVRPVSRWSKFNHVDFIFAKDVRPLLNEPLTQHLQELYEEYNK